MKLGMNVVGTAKLISWKEEEYRLQDGKTGKTYKIGVKVGNDLAEISASKEVFDRSTVIGECKPVSLYVEFDDRFGKIRVMGIDLIK